MQDPMPLQKPRPTEKVSFTDEDISASTPPRVRTIRRADTLHIAPSSSFYESAGRNRSRILLVFAFVAIIALLIGIAFTSRHYYVVWGGQNAFEGISQFKASTLGLDNGPELKARSNDVSLGKRSNVTACAAWESDCSAFDKPNICCSPQSSCYKTNYTLSGVYCCNKQNQTCVASELARPQCPADKHACSSEQGGGCCPSASLCTIQGCLLYDGSNLEMPVTTTLTATITSSVGSVKSTVTSTIISTLATGETIETTTSTAKKTVTHMLGESISPTATQVKEGEVLALSHGSSMLRSGGLGRYFQTGTFDQSTIRNLATIALVGVALFMSLL